MREIASVLILTAVCVTGFAASRSYAQEPQSILPALLAEIRGLRAAMEQMASAGPRVQLALGRLQLQEQRLNTLIMRLDGARASLTSAQRELTQHQNGVANFEAMLKGDSSGDHPPREEIEAMLAAGKQEAARLSAEVQRLMAEEASIASDIAAEQARWTEFNQRLEELERQLGRR